jgi:hypothetical protein
MGLKDTAASIQGKLSLKDYATSDDSKESKRLSGKALKSFDVKPASRRNLDKIKVTIYLTPEEERDLTEICHRRRISGEKIDRSTIVGEGIRMVKEKIKIEQ